jgi:hypothetical protein
MIEDYEGNWPEDFAHENGNYENICTTCKKHFLGHKRRCRCKVCAQQEAVIPWTHERLAELKRQFAAAEGKDFTFHLEGRQYEVVNAYTKYLIEYVEGLLE